MAKYTLYILDNLQIIHTAKGNNKDLLDERAGRYIEKLDRKGYDVGWVEYYIVENP